MDSKDKKKKKKKNKKGKKPASLLSFGGDEEEEPEFVLKKKKKRSSQTEELTRARKRARAKQKLREQTQSSGASRVQVAALGPRFVGKAPTEGLYSNLRTASGAYTASSGMYTPEQLNALKNNAVHTRVAPSKPRATEEDMEEDDNEEASPPDEKAQGTLIKQSDQVSLRQQERDHALVQAAREKRSRLRKIGDEYISLRKDREEQGLTTTLGGREYQMSMDEEHGGLVHDSGDDDVEDYIQRHTGRIKFGEGVDNRRKAIGSLVSKKKKKDKGINSLLRSGLDRQIEDEEEEDDDDGFLESLIRSGGGSLSSTSHRDLMVKRRRDAAAAAASASNTRSVVDTTPDQPPPRLSVAEIKTAISESLTAIKQDQSRKVRELERLRVDMQAATESVRDTDEALEKLNRKYLFFQSAKDEFATLLDMLKEKSTMIDGAWEELDERRAKYAQFLTDNRALHIQDEVYEAWGPAPPSSPKLDAFGRDVNYEATQGQERRKRERQERSASIAQHSADPEGWDGQDIDTTAKANLQRDEKELIKDAALIFQDVVPELAKLQFPRDKMQYMKEEYTQMYEDAYIGLSGPSVFAPYVRLQLLRWDPLATPTLDSMDWYGTLFDFGVVEGSPDDDAIPRIVEKIVVPFVLSVLSSCWHLYDPDHTTKAIELFREVTAHLLDDSPGFGALRTGIVNRLTSELKVHAKSPVVPTQTPHRPTPAATGEEATDREHRKLSFCRRQWWRALKFFTQVSRWLGVDSDMDPDILDILESNVTNALLPFLHFQVQCVSVAGIDKAHHSLVESVSLMGERLCVYLPSFASKLTDAASTSLKQLCMLLTAYMQTLKADSSLDQSQCTLKQGIALNKLLVHLRTMARQ